MSNTLVRHRQQTLRWAIAIASGAAVTWSFITHVAGRDLKTALDRAIVLPYLALLFSALAFIGLFRFARPRLRGLPRRAKIIWMLAALAIGAILVVAIPITAPPAPTLHRLEIVATGQKNADAKRSEVWVTGLFDGEGSQIAPSAFALDGAWEMIDGVPASREHQPATLRWEGRMVGDAQVQFITHPWSGMARITWDGQAQTVDLFANVETLAHRTVTLPSRDQPAVDLQSRLRNLTFAAVDSVSMGLLLFLVSVWPVTKVTRSSTKAAAEHQLGYHASLLIRRLMPRAQATHAELRSFFTRPLTLSLAWAAFVLAIVVAYMGLAVGRVSLDILYHADALYLPALYRDLAIGHDIKGWSFPPASYFFPDMPLFFGLNMVLGDFRLAILAYGLIQILLFIVGLISLSRLIAGRNSHAQSLVLIAGALFFLYFYAAPFPVLSLTLVSAHHFGVMVVGTGCLAIVTSTFRHPDINRKVVLHVLIALLFSTLTVASDMLYVIHFLVPAMLSVGLLLMLAAITYRRALVYGALCLSLPAGIVLSHMLTGSNGAATLPTFSLQRLHTGLIQLISWVQTFWLPHPLLSLAAISFVFLLGLALAVMVRARKQSAKRPQRLFVVSFLFFQLFACILGVLYVGNVNQRYLLPLIIMPTFFGWPLLIAAMRIPGNILNNHLRSQILAFVVMLICVSILARNGISTQSSQLTEYYPDLVRCMDEQTRQRHLQNGLSNYWQAKYISMLSHNDVHVVQIDPDLHPFYWINNRHWYEQPFEFIMIEPAQPEAFRLDRRKIVDRFGLPDDSFWCGSSEILIYHSPQFRDQFHGSGVN